MAKILMEEETIDGPQIQSLLAIRQYGENT
jgi:ATP-dependent Zn protease